VPRHDGMRRNSGEEIVLNFSASNLCLSKEDSNLDRPLTRFFELYRFVEFSSTSSLDIRRHWMFCIVYREVEK